jgi:hypothetical protein
MRKDSEVHSGYYTESPSVLANRFDVELMSTTDEARLDVGEQTLKSAEARSRRRE